MRMNAIAEIREKLARFLAPKREFLRFSAIEGGLPKGALVEFSGQAGSGKTETILRFLAQNPEVRVAWVEENFTIYPCAFPQAGVGLDRVLFVETGSVELLWSVNQILRSQIFGVVVLVAKEQNVIALRRLQIEAEKAGATVILVAETAQQIGNWPISLQLEFAREAEVAVFKILRRKGELAV